MNIDRLIRMGINAATTKPVWEVTVTHEGLNKCRRIRGTDKVLVNQKATALRAQWSDEWERRLDKERTRQKIESVREAKRRDLEKGNLLKQRDIEYQESLQAEANSRTQEAKEAVKALSDILFCTLSVNDEINWLSLKDHRQFNKHKPIFIPVFAPAFIPPESKEIPPEPLRDGFIPRIEFLDRMFPFRKARKLKRANERYIHAQENWMANKTRVETEYNEKLRKFQIERIDTEKRYKKLAEEYEARYARELQAYEDELAAFTGEQEARNAAVNASRESYLAGEAGAVQDYCEMVLGNSTYPDNFPQEYDLEYIGDNKILVVDYALPSLVCIPTLKEVRFLKTRNELLEISFTEKERAGIYDDVVYKLALRTLHELFEADHVNALDAVVFNGFVTSMDKSVGHDVTACIVTVQAGKDEFMGINLANVDPKACFKALRGVGSSQLHSLTAVPPLLQIDRVDRRFIDAKGVTDNLDATTNIATISWEDFEHLIRELFEKEFQQNGGECKVSRASRDGGVDAIAFDPDPIRGGKIVIQAKRYTKTVGVSAVRDLYGTVVNEGATKGILVSTSDYGPDSYGFAKGKPLTLLNGSNLLHLLSKHGHRARIDLQEARSLNNSSV